MSKHELIIVGAGPAGLAAAIEAAQHGVDIALVDENASLGGQYLCQSEALVPLHYGLFERRPRIKQRLLQQFPTRKVAVLQNATVCGIEDHAVLLIRGESKLERIPYDRLILAPGAYDLPFPFPGWTLPGVITAGAALSLLKRQGILPGRRIVLAGRGLLLVALAAELIAAGGNVVSIVEATPVAGWWKALRASTTKLDVAFEGVGYWARILRHGTKYRPSRLVTQALGKDRVEEICVSRVDEEWRPIPGTQESMQVDALCLGFGFVPSAHLFRLAGCAGQWKPEYRAWVPSYDECMQTNLDDIFAAGDGAAPEGADVAEIEGRIAGLTATWQLGHLGKTEWTDRVGDLQTKLAALREFRKIVDSSFRLGKEADALLTEDSLICRCEEVTMGEVATALRDGAQDLNTLKGWTRVGMGRCQGRMCEPSLVYLLHKHLNGEWPLLQGFTPRFPVKPIPFATMVGSTNGGKNNDQ
jgi:NADPH-dependent 2,4-dienoyl-CoA reductase/sulfur reductase-like enzyme